MDWKPQEVVECPHCKAPCNAIASPEGGDGPTNDAMSLCFSCGGLSIYVITETTRALRKATLSEEAEVKDDPSILRARKMLSYTASGRLASSLMGMSS